MFISTSTTGVNWFVTSDHLIQAIHVSGISSTGNGIALDTDNGIPPIEKSIKNGSLGWTFDNYQILLPPPVTLSGRLEMWLPTDFQNNH